MNASSFHEIKKIIIKPPGQRTAADIENLSFFISGLSFFKSSILKENSNLLNKACKYLQYEFFPDNSFVFLSGSPGDKFYIILKGSVQVQEDKDDSSEFVTLTQGKSFGEYALLYNKSRMASILSLKAHLGYLLKSHYLEILGKYENDRIIGLTSFLKSMSIFKFWPTSGLARLSYSITQKNYFRKKVIFRQGEKIEKVCFIKTGEIELIKSVKHKKTMKNLHVSLLAKGEIVGDEVLTQDSYLYTCVVHSCEAEVLVISKKRFLNVIRNEESQKIAKSSHEHKEKGRIQRLNSLNSLKISDERETENPVNRKLSSSPKILIRRPKPKSINHIALSGQSKISLNLKKSGLNWRNESCVSPVYLSMQGKFLEQRDIFPLSIEAKQLSDRPKTRRDLNSFT